MINEEIKCDYPCLDVNRNIIYPRAELNCDLIKLVMISEAPSVDFSNYFYKDLAASFFQTTKNGIPGCGHQL